MTDSKELAVPPRPGAGPIARLIPGVAAIRVTHRVAVVGREELSMHRVRAEGSHPKR
jgi:hypothetical protein